jgi:ATP-dependent Clp protease ATP-binding subunit ClpA
LSDENAQIPTEQPTEPSHVERAVAKLSGPCRRAYQLACDEARRSGAAYIGAAHLLIGLAESGETAAARVFESLALSANEVRARLGFVEGMTPNASANGAGLPLSPRAQRVLLAAEREGGKQGAAQIGTLHLLHALVAEREGVAVFVLEEPGVGLERLGAALQKALREQWEDGARG